MIFLALHDGKQAMLQKHVPFYFVLHLFSYFWCGGLTDAGIAPLWEMLPCLLNVKNLNSTLSISFLRDWQSIHICIYTYKQGSLLQKGLLTLMYFQTYVAANSPDWPEHKVDGKGNKNYPLNMKQRNIYPFLVAAGLHYEFK